MPKHVDRTGRAGGGKVLLAPPIGRGEGVCLARSANQRADFSTWVSGKRVEAK